MMAFVLIIKAQDLNKYDRGNFIKGKDSIYYRILFPENFNPAKKYPILFFLHGSGERGNNNESQLVHGGKLFLKEEIRKNFPAIIIHGQHVVKQRGLFYKLLLLPIQPNVAASNGIFGS